jgi:tetratricopeptide (TPR) repeat protein
MGLFDRLFRRRSGRRPADPPAPAATPAAAPVPSSSQPPPASQTKPAPPPDVKLFDAYGRPMRVPRDVFRTKVLPSTFQRDWNSADALARTVMSALNDGFLEETLDAARQLERIDSDRHRGATLLGVNLLRLKRFKEAEAILATAVKRSGPHGAVLANLAIVESALGEEARAQKTLWRSLECDPNLPVALNWYAEQARRRGGDAAEQAALQSVAWLPGSWLAQLRLAALELKAKRPAAALERCREVLERLKPVPAEALVKISGDLCNAGLVSEALALCTPHYVAAQHGLPAGANLIHAYIAQKDGASARRLLDELYAVPRADWREPLASLERAISEIDRGYGAVADPKTLEMTMLVFARPLWLHDGEAFVRHFPRRSPEAVHVAFMSGSVRNSDTASAKVPVAKPADPTGRFSRAVPIYLAEQLHLRSDARASLLIPWLRRGGLVLSCQPWSPDLLAAMNPKPDYLALLHLDAIATPMQLKLTVVRAIDESTVVSFERPVRLDDDFAPVRELADALLHELAVRADVNLRIPPPFLTPWSSTRLPAWCHALEQALAVHCASQVPLNRPFLSGERNILDHLLDLSLREPKNVAARLLFLVTLERQSRLKSAIAAEYKGRVERLQKEWPLGAEGEEMAREVLGRVVWE